MNQALANKYVSVEYCVGAFIISTCAISLNSAEIVLLWKRWKKLTHFELILLNLAIADFLAALFGLATAIVTTYIYVSKSTNVNLLLALLYIMVFPVLSSTIFVLLIGVERLTAIRVPLLHRSSRSSRKLTAKLIFAAWALNIALSIAFITSFVLVREPQTSPDKSNSTVAFTLGGFLTFGVVLTFVFYTWMLHLILKRNSAFLKYDANETTCKKIIFGAIKKEKASLVVCLLVVVTYLACNIPFVILLFTRTQFAWKGILAIMNSFTNPLIYFFKGYFERHLARNKSELNSSSTNERAKVRDTVKESSNGFTHEQNGKEKKTTGITADHGEDERIGLDNLAFSDLLYENKSNTIDN